MQTAVIKESLRITALVTSRLPLVSPVEALEYGGWQIPVGVRAITHHASTSCGQLIPT